MTDRYLLLSVPYGDSTNLDPLALLVPLDSTVQNVLRGRMAAATYVRELENARASVVIPCNLVTWVSLRDRMDLADRLELSEDEIIVLTAEEIAGWTNPAGFDERVYRSECGALDNRVCWKMIYQQETDGPYPRVESIWLGQTRIETLWEVPNAIYT